MREDLDRWLSDCAPEAPDFQAHCKNLRTDLAASLQMRQQRWRPLLLAMACAVGLLVGFGGPNDTGSDGFEVALEANTPQTGPVYTPVNNPQIAIGGQGLASLPPAEAKRAVESYQRMAMACEARLVGATGWTLQEQTAFLADYAVEIAGETTNFVERPAFPTSVASPRHDEFFREGGVSDFLQHLGEGRARFIGTEERFFDGRAMRFKKWVAELPRWGQVVFWQGTPLGP
jgi:hypothetical protein